MKKQQNKKNAYKTIAYKKITLNLSNNKKMLIKQ